MNNKTGLQLSIPVLYFVFLALLGNSLYVVPSLIMAVSLYITLAYIYDFDSSIFTMSNIICVIGLFLGFYTRYVVCILDPSRLTDFAPFPLEESFNGHLKTSALLLVFVICYALMKRHIQKKEAVYKYTREESLPCTNSFRVAIVYLLLVCVYEFYNFRNINTAVELSYGTYDQLFRLMGYIVKIIAYIYLFQFSQKKRFRSFALYLCYLCPAVTLALIQAWKGSILIEILVFCIVFQGNSKRIKTRFVVIVLAALVVVFPLVSMIREYYKYGTSLDLSVSALLKYNSKHNVLKFYLDRFSYYDGIYYVANTSKNLITEYKLEAGTIVQRFLSGIIPRFLWPDKPIVNVGKYVTYILLKYPTTTYNNLTVGLLADAYLDAGAVGVAIIGLFFGYLVAQNEKHHNSSNVVFKSYYIVLGQALFGFLEGDIASKVLGMIFVIIAMFICYGLVYGRIFLTRLKLSR